jgi:AcrR family transcriptional regulator
VTAAKRLRRVPSQARSRARVQRLLDAADAIIGADGYAALTIPHLAHVANVAVGTLYQFFPDKEAVVEAVADRYMELFGTTLRSFIDRSPPPPWDQLADEVIERFVALYRQHAAYRTLWVGGHLDAALADRDRRNNDEIGELLVELLRRRPEFQGADPARLALAARLAVEAADALLRYAFLRHPNGDQRVIDEVKRMLSLYLLTVRAQPPPPVPARTDR